MATYQGYSTTDWARTLNTTLTKHLRKEEEAHLRNYQLGALLDANGKVEYNCSGRGFDWPVRYRNHTMEGNTGETTRNFVRKNLDKVANLEFRGYQVVDSIRYKEMRENRGREGIVKVFDNFVSRLTESIKEGLGTEYYIDGSASGNEQSWHGFESMFAATQTINVSTGVARTANAADRVMAPNDTYAGIATALSSAGGGANESGAVWPDGLADPEYDFWAPLIVNYTSTALGGTADTWAAQGNEAMRYGIIHTQRNAGMDTQMTNILLARTLYFDLLNLIDDKERIAITGQNNLRALGFKNILNFDGMEVSWEAGVPTAVGYGFNYNCIELKCMDDTMYRVEGPEPDIFTQSYNAVVSTLSNLKFKSPRNFMKLIAAA